jgi:hypothetical protein
MANLPEEGRAFWLLEFRDGLRLDMAGLKEGGLDAAFLPFGFGFLARQESCYSLYLLVALVITHDNGASQQFHRLAHNTFLFFKGPFLVLSSAKTNRPSKLDITCTQVQSRGWLVWLPLGLGSSRCGGLHTRSGAIR